VIDPSNPADDFDLALRKTVNGSAFTPWSEVVYTITVFNQWDVSASNTQVTDYIPNGLTFVSTTATVVSESADEVVLWGFWAIAAWANTSETVTFMIDDSFTGTIENIVEITQDSWSDIDSTIDASPSNDPVVDNEINNTGGDEDDHDIEEITVTGEVSDGYDLALRKTVDWSTYTQGSQVRFTIEIFNQWDTDASNIEVTDYFPEELIFQSTTATIISETDDEIVLDFGSISSGESETETITFTIDRSFSWNLENLAEITRDNGNDIDSTVDDSSTNDVLVNDVINNSWNDEDDHDAEEITVLRRSSGWWGWGSWWGRNFCWDGNLSVIRGEQCDDGNYVDGDWCNRNCQLESDPVVVEEDPELCQIESRCGDGIIGHNGDPTTKEQCDDGNTINGDWCSNNCLIEIVAPVVVPVPVVQPIVIEEPEIVLPFIPQPVYAPLPNPEPLMLPAYLPETWVLNGGQLNGWISMIALLVRKEEERKSC